MDQNFPMPFVLDRRQKAGKSAASILKGWLPWTPGPEGRTVSMLSSRRRNLRAS